MSLAKKMYLTDATVVPCVHLAADVDLGDISPWAATVENARQMVIDGKSNAIFVFVENSAQLSQQLGMLKSLWDEKITFWVFYPKKPHLNTDLGRDKTWELMQKEGMKGTRQVGVDSLWSCLYYKNSAK